MNTTLPEPNNNAYPFANSRQLLIRIAVGLGLYSALVLYPAFVGLHYLYADALPSLTQVLVVAGCAGAFILFSLAQMTNLSPPQAQPAEKSS